MSVYVIVDDTDSGIDYYPRAGNGNGTTFKNVSIEQNGWFVGAKGDPTEFRETTTGTGVDSSTLSYTFNGSSIWVFCTYEGGPTDESFQTTNVSFSIDGDIIEENSYPHLPNTHYHFPSFTYVSSSFNTHTLDIEITSTNISNTTFNDLLIDYMIYEASVNSSIPTAEDGTSWIFIDDTSPYLTASNDWSRTGSLPNFSPPEAGENITDATLNSTVLAPTASGATISLNFTGASNIEAYGMVLQNTSSGQLGTYNIDGQSDSSLGVDQLPSSYPVFSYWLLTAAIENPDAPHVLTITASEPNAFFLDYILLQADSAFVTSASLDSIPPAPNTTHDPAPTTSAASRKQTKTGGIVGGVVGGVFVLGLVGLVVLFGLRKRRRAPGTIHGEERVDISVEDRYSSVMQEQEQCQGLSSGSYPRSDYTTTPTPFSPTSLGSNSGYIDSQSRKIGTSAHTARPMSNTPTNPNTNPSTAGSSSTRRQGAVNEMSHTPFVLENDSGLRGRELA